MSLGINSIVSASHCWEDRRVPPHLDVSMDAGYLDSGPHASGPQQALHQLNHIPTPALFLYFQFTLISGGLHGVINKAWF